MQIYLTHLDITDDSSDAAAAAAIDATSVALFVLPVLLLYPLLALEVVLCQGEGGLKQGQNQLGHGKG